MGGKDIKVELLPSPGTVNKEGRATYPLGKEPGSETIILQVTNAEGEQKSRSVTIESFLPEEDVEEGTDGAEGQKHKKIKTGQREKKKGQMGQKHKKVKTGQKGESEGEKAAGKAGKEEEGDGAPPPLPEPPGASPPIPPGRNSPPPIDLPPAIQ